MSVRDSIKAAEAVRADSVDIDAANLAAFVAEVGSTCEELIALCRCDGRVLAPTKKLLEALNGECEPEDDCTELDELRRPSLED